MVALLLYAYSRGVYSSRKIARLVRNGSTTSVTAMNRPDHRTIARFRRDLKALGRLVRAGAQAVPGGRAGQAPGMWRSTAPRCRPMPACTRRCPMGGGKPKRSFPPRSRIGLPTPRPPMRRKIVSMVPRSAATRCRIGSPTRRHGSSRIRAAKAALEAEAKQPPPQDDDRPGPSSGMMKSGKTERGATAARLIAPSATHRPTAASSRRAAAAVIQGYNAVIAVDGALRLSIAQRLQTSPADGRALGPLLAAARNVLRAIRARSLPTLASAMKPISLVSPAAGSTLFLAPGRARHGERHAGGRRRWRKGSRIAATATKLRRAGRRSRYRFRKQIVDPVFGQINMPGLPTVPSAWLRKGRESRMGAHPPPTLLKLAKATG